MEEKKQRIIVINDEDLPTLVRALETADDVLIDEFALERIQEAVGPETCPHCDDNQGRTDGRGCAGCNIVASMIDNAEVQRAWTEGEDLGR